MTARLSLSRQGGPQHDLALNDSKHLGPERQKASRRESRGPRRSLGHARPWPRYSVPSPTARQADFAVGDGQFLAQSDCKEPAGTAWDCGAPRTRGSVRVGPARFAALGLFWAFGIGADLADGE
jgi:hypothetical protein